MTKQVIVRQAYKQCKKEAKKAVAIARSNAYNELYTELDTKNVQLKILRLAKETQGTCHIYDR